MILSKFVNRYTCNFKSLPNVINRIKSNNQIPIIDYANEDHVNYNHNFKVIKDSIKNYPNNTFALKFSSLGLSSKSESNNAFHLSKKIINLAVENNSNILIDAEQNNIQKIINRWSGKLILEFNKNKPVVYKTYQMYRKDSFNVFSNDLKIFENTHLGIKLVRGAYYNTDKKYGVLYNSKCETDEAFNNAIKYFFKINNPKHHLIVASHNEESIKLLDNYNKNIIWHLDFQINCLMN